MFAQSFKDGKVKLGDLEFVVTEETISQATRIPLQGESWFEGRELYSAHFKEFVKPQFKNKDATILPRTYLLNQHNQLLKFIQRYFTCEGKFNTMYQYHIGLIMHLTGRSLNLPYYLLKNLGKWKGANKGRQTSVQHVPFIPN